MFAAMLLIYCLKFRCCQVFTTSKETIAAQHIGNFRNLENVKTTIVTHQAVIAANDNAAVTHARVCTSVCAHHTRAPCRKSHA